MGASQSAFFKANQPTDTAVDLNSLRSTLVSPEPPSSFSQYGIGLTAPNIVDDDLKRYTDEYEFLLGKHGSCPDATDEEIKKDLEEIENAYKLYLLYDNYKVKNKVMNEDLNKKFRNQTKNIKNSYEVLDKININIKQLEQSILNKKRTQKILNFIIAILVIIILVLAFLIYKKKFANYNFSNNTNTSGRRNNNTNTNGRRNNNINNRNNRP